MNQNSETLWKRVGRCDARIWPEGRAVPEASGADADALAKATEARWGRAGGCLAICGGW